MPLGLVQGIANIFTSKRANKELDKVLAQDPTYTKSPYAAQQYGLAKQMFGGRMFGAADLQRNIFSNQANFQSNINRNATDSSQALALGAAGQGQTNEALGNLQIQEAQNKYGMLSNLNNAYGAMINEDDKVYQDKVRRFGDLAQIRGAQTQNRTGAVNGVFNGINSDFNDMMNILGMFTGMGGGKMGGGSGGASGGGMR